MTKKIFMFFSLLVIFLNSISIPVSFASPTVDEWYDQQKNNMQEEVNETDDSVVEDQQEQGSSSPNFILQLLQLFLALAVVIGLIYFLLKFMSNKNKMFNKVRALENLGGIGLGSNKSLQVIRIGERFYVLGVGENVELLSEITDQRTIDDLVSDEKTTDFNLGDFLSSGFKKQQESKPKQNNKTDKFPKLFENELNQMVQERRKIKQQIKGKEDDRNE